MFFVIPERICVLGEIQNLFFRNTPSVSAIEYLPFVDAGACFSVVYPSSSADAKVSAFLPSATPRKSYATAALATANALCRRNSKSADVLNIEVPYGILKIVRLDGELGVLLPKRKVLRTKTLKYASSLLQICREVHTERGVVRVFECKDSRMYSEEALALFSFGDDRENVCATVAVSRRGAYLTMRSHTVSSIENAELYALVCGVSAFIDQAPEPLFVYCELSGVVFKVSAYEDGLLVSSPAWFLTKQ